MHEDGKHDIERKRKMQRCQHGGKGGKGGTQHHQDTGTKTHRKCINKRRKRFVDTIKGKENGGTAK